MILIGIDLSINSTGVCILQQENKEWKLKEIYSLTRSDDSGEKIISKKSQPYQTLDILDEVNLDFMDKRKPPTIYHEREKAKQITYEEIVGKITNFIDSRIKNKTEKIYTAMEGISFGSSGNSLIDISMTTGILRKYLMEISEDFFVFSPGTVKKVLGNKGNAKKWELYDTLIETDNPIINESEYIKVLKKNKCDWVLPSKNVKKPVDDVNDSILVALTLLDCLKDKGLLDK